MPSMSLSGGGSSSSGGLKPSQFYLPVYGAKQDGVLFNDVTMNNGSALATSPSNVFSKAKVGQSILVSCAGGGTYTPLAAKIVGIGLGGGTAQLSVAASSTTPGAVLGGFATDDTAAVIAAQAAGVAYAQGTGNGYYEVIADTALIGMAANPIIGTAVGGGNAQVPWPNIADTGQKIIGAYTTAINRGYDQALMHWLQQIPQASGCVYMCLNYSGTNDGTYGPSAMFGGPFRGYGGGALANFSNFMPVIDGVNLLLPYNSNICGWDFYGVAEKQIVSSSAMPMGIVPAAPPYPNCTNSNNLANAWTFGSRDPSTGNNDRSDTLYFSAEGITYGYMWSEHSVLESARLIYCVIGYEGYSGNGVAMPHASRATAISCEGSAQGMGFTNGSGNMDVSTLDCETVTNQVYDPSNLMTGTVGTRGGSNRSGGAGVRIRNLDQPPGPVSSPSAPPASGSAWTNNYVNDVEVAITITTGTVTAITITGQNGVTKSLTLPAATATPAPFMVPCNSTYTPTFTGTIAHSIVVF